MTVDQILKKALKYKKEGANVIDLGCLPDTEFKHLEESIKALKKIKLKVSVDSANENELLRGGKIPVNNSHSVIDNPESVSLVRPPTTIISATSQNIKVSQ